MRYPIPSDTAASQARASDPQNSAWVSANAGSGKTHVLAQRVIRLLLNGTDPSKILCLTYTRAAAANMSNRVFSTLSEWTTLPDAELGGRIAALDGRAEYVIKGRYAEQAVLGEVLAETRRPRGCGRRSAGSGMRRQPVTCASISVS